VQVGNIVDRGNDSRKALDFLKRLEHDAPAGQVHILLGNHEVARMLGDLRLTTAGEYAAFADRDSENLRQRFVRSANVTSDDEREALMQKTPLGWVEMRQASGRDGEYGKWLRELPVVMTIDGFVFVHGGISPAVAPLGCEAINAQVRRELTGDLDKTRGAPLSSLAARVDGPLWYRGLAQHELAFVVGAPQDVGFCRPHQRRPGRPRSPLPTPVYQSVPIEYRMHRADRRQQPGRALLAQFLPNLRGAPVGILPLQPDDGRLNRGWQPIRLAIRAATAVIERRHPAVLVAIENLVARFA
jgi:hypothetical protein